MNNIILQGHVLHKLKELSNESVDCVVTSPPYFGLRAYGTEPVIWDGLSDCEHEWTEKTITREHGQTGATGRGSPTTIIHKSTNTNGTCNKCGAWRGELGLEPSPDLFVKHLCDVFDEVKRVLKPSGSCFANLGDSYAGSGKGIGCDDTKESWHFSRKPEQKTTIPNKCLMQIPSRFAIEMCSRGWILRNDLIWHKPNCMPSSASDRFTVDFERIFFFTKSPDYFFEQQFEPLQITSVMRVEYGWFGKKLLREDSYNGMKHTERMGERFAPIRGRNMRCVWKFPTRPFSAAHFAVFPEELPERCIKAGCPEFVCVKCGSPRERITKDVKRELSEDYRGKGQKEYEINGVQNPSDVKRRILDAMRTEKQIVGMSDCGCNAGWKHGVVLDPFLGSGTTAIVAERLRRDWLGIELNDNFVRMAEMRIAGLTNWDIFADIERGSQKTLSEVQDELV
jgi:DNA modification methylase